LIWEARAEAEVEPEAENEEAEPEAAETGVSSSACSTVAYKVLMHASSLAFSSAVSAFAEKSSTPAISTTAGALPVADLIDKLEVLSGGRGAATSRHASTSSRAPMASLSPFVT
tara:strand:- start:319 stop:660 length:342 start_codon:yes stop_codon:yes gene_type:complete